MKKQSMCLLLALLMLSTASCASGTETPSGSENDTPVSQSDESETAEETEDPYPFTSGIPTKSFGNSTFTILGELIRDHHNAEELTGEGINDAVYYRNLDVEDRYDVDIQYDLVEWKLGDDKIQTSVLAQDNAYNLATSTHLSLGNCLTSGYFIDWNTIAQVDMTQPYYVESANKTYSIGDKTMLLFGDYMDSNINNCWVFLSNKRLLTQYGIENLYEVVDSGKWTIDYFLSLVGDLYEDTNGNGRRDIADTYGFVTDMYGSVDSFSRTFHLSAVAKDEQNYPYLNFYNETTVSAYELLYKMYYDTTGISGRNEAFVQLGRAFIPGLAVFSNHLMISLYGEDMRNMEDDYGILPYPKYVETDPTYQTYLDGTFSSQMILITTPESDLERVGMITEALNAYSRQHVVPAIYDTALKTKVVRDAESSRMIDLILEGRTFSFESFDEEGFKLSPALSLRDNIIRRQNSITSYYEANKSACEAWIENMITAFNEGALAQEALQQ